jgi:ankyrin repeat protein
MDNTKYKEYNELFIYACESGFIHVVKDLIKNPIIDTSYSKSLSIKRAIKNGHLDIVKMLIDNYEINDDGIMEYATSYFQYDIIIYLYNIIDTYGNRKYTFKNSLVWAVYNKHIALTELILNNSSGIDCLKELSIFPHCQYNNVISMTIKKDSEDITFLIKTYILINVARIIKKINIVKRFLLKYIIYILIVNIFIDLQVNLIKKT